MSAFNVLRASASCPSCGTLAPQEIQFKYGDTWQHTYNVGDTLRWGGNDVGQPGCRRVLVEGIGGPCPSCGEQYLEYDITVEHDRITAVTPVGLRRSNPSKEGYVVEA